MSPTNAAIADAALRAWQRAPIKSDRRSHLPLDHHPLDLGDGLGGGEALRAGLGAVHDGVAAVEAERILEIVEALSGRLVAAVLEPAVGLEQRGGAHATPPVSTKY